MLPKVLRSVWLAAIVGTSMLHHVVAEEAQAHMGEMPELELFGVGGFQAINEAPIMAMENSTTSTPASATIATSTSTVSEQQSVPNSACTFPYEACSPRHHLEKESLLVRVSKKTGKWDTNHPRYRLLKALDAYLSYARLQRAEIDRWRQMYTHVPQSQKDMLENTPGVVGYKQKLNHLEHLVDKNAKLCEDIARDGMEYYGVTGKEWSDFAKVESKAGRGSERYSVVQGLKHLVRDWTVDGAGERRQAFPCVLEAVKVVKERMIKERVEAGDAKRKVEVLLPGSGLGRLGHEVASLGDIEVTINEWSTYMILPYRFLEKHFSKPFIDHDISTKTFHPFIDSLSHHAKNENLYRPAVLSHDSIFQSFEVLLVEGDFTTVFAATDGTTQPQFDIIVTHYFIDTARNIMAYLTTIHALLRPGGAWINFGPLLYGTGPWVQLSLDEVILVSENMGFEFEDMPTPSDLMEGHVCGGRTFQDGEMNIIDGALRQIRGRYSGYQFDEKALTKNAYFAQSWLARKKE